HADAFAPSVRHLCSDGALPNQFVNLGLVGPGVRHNLIRMFKEITRGTDRFMRCLRIFYLDFVYTRSVVRVLFAIQIRDAGASSLERRFRQRSAVGTHIGNVTILIETLRSAHGASGRKTKLSTGFLLQR